MAIWAPAVLLVVSAPVHWLTSLLRADGAAHTAVERDHELTHLERVTGRIAQVPDVPTVAESGVPGFAVDNWYGFQAPRGVPTPIAMKLHSEINRIMTMADVTARLAGLGIFPFTLPTHTAYGQYIQSEIKKYGEVVKGAGVKVD